jgi:hypothetical protein
MGNAGINKKKLKKKKYRLIESYPLFEHTNFVSIQFDSP